ncbi:MAG TPA: ABC transporter permease [Acetobacteraceae bacterium]|nr:ABC transporter permease [Acetobacteraceae bacterium]
MRRRGNLILGGALVALIVAAGLLAPVIAGSAAFAQNLGNAMLPPSAAHWLGTDQYGRDLFARIVYGARISLFEVALGVGMAMAAGIPAGLVAGWFGALTDEVIGWSTNILFAFPGIILAILIVSVLGPGLFNLLLAIAIFSVPVYVRLTRNLTLALKQIDYVEAARSTGASTARVLFQHVLRNALPPLLVQATLTAGTVILAAASLSFLGLGAQPPLPEWGAMMSSARDLLGVDNDLSLFPGLAITVAVLGFNLLGDGVRDLLDPHRGVRG